MTYFGVLTAFILPLLAALVLMVVLSDSRRRPGRTVDRRHYLAVGIHVLLALVYTTPWDNYLVATGVWWYDPALVNGLRIGWVPIEEYLFFIVQTLFTGFWLLALMRWGVPVRGDVVSPRQGVSIRSGVSAAVVALWLVFTVLLFSGWMPGRYLALILSWALLPVLLQMAFGADLLWVNRRLVLLGLLPTTLYLWLVDALAIRSGTWTIDPAQTTGWMVGPLPVEEMIFFFLTNSLIVFGITLFLAPGSRERARQLAARLGRFKVSRRDPQTQGAD
jgi:lycopene cyclase domain-containing protein